MINNCRQGRLVDESGFGEKSGFHFRPAESEIL